MMNAHRTPWWHAVIAMVLGLGAGAGIAVLGESSGTTLIGTPWFVAVVLGAIGIVALALAVNVHKYATTDPKKRPKTFVNPSVAFNTLVLCKSMILAGAALAGWYGGQIIPTLAHIEGSFYEHAVLECAVTAVVCLADMVIGFVGEWLCRLPPTEGHENPKMQEQQRQGGLAGATAKTMR